MSAATSPPPQKYSRLPSLLKMAILSGVSAAVKVFVGKGQFLDAVDERGRTPLMLAASKGHFEICRILLDGGANPHILDPQGCDALDLAVQGRHSATVLLLKKYFPDEQDSLQKDSIQYLTPLPATSTQDSFEFLEDSTFLLDSEDWEVEAEILLPPENPQSIVIPSTTQKKLSHHILIDDRSDWGDVEVILPESANILRLQRILGEENTDWVFAIKDLFYFGAQLGWITRPLLEDTLPEETGLRCHLLLRRKLEKALALLNINVFDETNMLIEPGEVSANLAISKYEFTDEIEEAFNWFLESVLVEEEEDKYSYFSYLSSHRRISAEQEREYIESFKLHYHQFYLEIASTPWVLKELLVYLKQVEQGLVPLEEISHIRNLRKKSLRSKAEDPNSSAVIELPTAFSVPLYLAEQALAAYQSENLLSEVARATLAKDLVRLQLTHKFLLKFSERVQSNQEGLLHLNLVDHYKVVCKCRDALFLGHWPLVPWVAEKISGLPILERIQEGNLGLLKAIERFNPSYGSKLSTFAPWWIRQTIIRSIHNQSLLVRLPSHIYGDYWKIKKAVSQLEKDFEEDLNILSLAKLTGVEVRKVQLLTEAPTSFLSLDTDELDSIPLWTHLETNFWEDPNIRQDVEEVYEALTEVLSQISPRQRDVLRLRFGLDDGRERTLEEVGQLFGVTRERIRQIESKALHSLRGYSAQKLLKELLGMEPS